MSFLQTDLDVLLLLEHEYQFTKLLLDMQRSNRRNRNANYALDTETCNLVLDDNESEHSDEEFTVQNVDDDTQYVYFGVFYIFVRCLFLIGTLHFFKREWNYNRHAIS